MLFREFALVLSSALYSLYWRLRLNSSGSQAIAACLSFFSPKPSGVPLIRLGGPGDGGYLVPDDLEGITALFSPGVSNQTSFEDELSARGIKCFLADASIAENPPKNQAMHFDPLWLVGFPQAKNEIDLTSWIRRYAPGEELILQMDIEGSEYEVLLSSSPETMERFRILVVEFHGLHQVFNETGRKIISAVGAKLGQTHTVSHIHTNNLCRVCTTANLTVPNCLEVTLLRNDRLGKSNEKPRVPHELDQPTSPRVPQGNPRW